MSFRKTVGRLLGFADRDPASDFWYEPITRPTHSGQHVTPDTALRVSAVLACVRVLAETIASLPVHIFRVTDDGREEAREHPLSEVLRKRPNSYQTSFEFREMMMGHAALRGNAYAQILSGPRGAVDQLIPIHPDKVEVERLENGRLRYKVTQPDGHQKTHTQDEIFHLRWLSLDGVKGLSPIELAREAVGLTMAAEAYGARFFGHNARPSGILSTPNRLTKEAAERMRASWQAAHAGDNSHRVAVLEEDTTWTTVGMSNTDGQFIELRELQIADIARIFRVPPHLIGDLRRSTFSNIEHQSIDFVTHTIRPWLVRWEQAISRDLLADDESYYAEFNVDGLLRGDNRTRIEINSNRFQNGRASINELRALDNKPPIPGGDRYFIPRFLAPIDRIDETIQAPSESLALAA